MEESCILQLSVVTAMGSNVLGALYPQVTTILISVVIQSPPFVFTIQG